MQKNIFKEITDVFSYILIFIAVLIAFICARTLLSNLDDDVHEEWVYNKKKSFFL